MPRAGSEAELGTGVAARENLGGGGQAEKMGVPKRPCPSVDV